MKKESALSSKALLVSLQVRQWEARRLDKRETLAVAAKHNAAAGVARVNKDLLPAAAQLNAVHKKTNAIRHEYYTRTLAWKQDGVNIIRADAYLGFTEVMSEHMREWRRLVDAFIAEYPVLVAEAQLRLGSLYDPDDYPAVSDVRRRFEIGLTFLPVSDAADWRVDVGDEAMAQLRAQLQAEIEDSVGVAMKDAWKRVYEVVSKAHERLSKPDAIFRDSLVDNARELCAVLPQLNLTDDPELERLRYRLEGSICKHAPDTLRTSPDTRAKVAGEMHDIMAKMSAMYGAAA